MFKSVQIPKKPQDPIFFEDYDSEINQYECIKHNIDQGSDSYESSNSLNSA